MPEFTSPKLEEFYNHVHDSATGRFSGRAASGRAGFREGSPGTGRQTSSTVTPAIGSRKANYDKLTRDQQKKLASDVLLRNNPYLRSRVGGRRGEATSALHGHPGAQPNTHVTGNVAKQGAALMKKQAAHRAEAVRQIDLRNERIRAAAPTNSRTKIPQGPQHGNRGGPHIRAADKLPLRNATTGRINPLPVRHAFKQGLSEIISKRKEDSKRTTLKGGSVRTVGTYKGRVIKHVSSKGGVNGRKKFVNPLSGVYVK